MNCYDYNDVVVAAYGDYYDDEEDDDDDDDDDDHHHRDCYLNKKSIRSNDVHNCNFFP